MKSFFYSFLKNVHINNTSSMSSNLIDSSFLPEQEQNIFFSSVSRLSVPEYTDTWNTMNDTSN